MASKSIEMAEKENNQVGLVQGKKEKASGEQVQLKTILGEVQIKTSVNEPTSPEDSKLIEKKRVMERQNIESFAFKLTYC